LVLTVDEDREQTKAIHRRQRRRRTLEGKRDRRERTRIRSLHKNAQRLLRSLDVVNPFAERLTFLDDRTRTRRDHEKYLTLIEAVALLRQHQRELKQDGDDEYIEVMPEDIATANQLARDVLGNCLDELPAQTRKFLRALVLMVNEGCERDGIESCDFRFTRREARCYSNGSETQVRLHLDRLVELEYVLVHRGGRGQGFLYELVYEPSWDNQQSFLRSLIGGGSTVTVASSRNELAVRGLFAGHSRPSKSEVEPKDSAGSGKPRGVLEGAFRGPQKNTSRNGRSLGA
jgi:hypothetical protein